MSMRRTRILFAATGCAICLTWLSGCTSAPKLDDSSTQNVESASTDVTGSVRTQPAEPGPSGEPIAPLSAPGLAGDDPNDDLQLGKKYFRSEAQTSELQSRPT